MAVSAARAAVLIALFASALLCVSGASEESASASPPPKETTESREESDAKKGIPPRLFPEDRALPYTPGKLPEKLEPGKASSEATDMMKDAPAASAAPAATAPAPAGDNDATAATNETEPVKHPNVRDPGTTHAEGSSVGTIHACLLPPAGAAESSAADWLADGGNVTQLCHLPLEWLNGNGTIHVCSIPKDVWENAHPAKDGVIPKELLRELNDTVSCVTPNDAMTENATASPDPLVNGTIPSAWLRDSNDNIYIYIIPREWLNGGKAKDDGDPAVSTPAEGSSPPAESSSKPTENSSKPTESYSKPTESSSKPTDAAAPSGATEGSNATVTNATTPATGASANATSSSVAAATTAPSAVVPSAPAASPAGQEETGKASTTTTTKTTTTTTTTTTAVPSSAEPNVADNEIEGVTPPAPPAALSQQHSDHEHLTNGKTAFLQPTESAAILAGVFVAIALLGYAGLLLWRRVLEKRYGNREMLVNEDDDFDTSDMRHFEL